MQTTFAGARATQETLNENLNNIVIVLTRPSESGNIGAVCRAMKNFGLTNLRITAPTNINSEVIIARAVHAAEIWHNATTFDTLHEALADCSLVIGTSRRRGRARKPTLTPRETALYIQNRIAKLSADEQCDTKKPIALVFGNERTGLESDELALCNFASHIPVSGEFPSLNLSHAVQIYCYELFLAISETASDQAQGAWQPLAKEQIESLSSSVCDDLAEFGFYKIRGREEQQQFFTDIFSRAGLNRHEAWYMKNIFAKAARLNTL
jgi:tRNA/rRNA methyltransferase/tRNA (cytidine32/uridine32-2'-O)-methyltransferase